MARYDRGVRGRPAYDREYGSRGYPGGGGVGGTPLPYGVPGPYAGDPFRGRDGHGYDRISLDDQIRMEVRQRFLEDSWLDARRIDIQVRDRVVTLTGEVRQHMEARYAWDDAWETEGVRGVISRIEVPEAGGAESGEAEG